MEAGAVVNVDNFVEAETARMFDDISALAGGVNHWLHFRAPTPIDQQPVIRMNRDTLYSAAVVDLADGARLTLPDTRDRYLSVMAVNASHHLNRVYREPGTHDRSAAERGSQHVLLAARLFVDPFDPDDVAAVNALQGQFTVEAGSATPFTHPDYDTTTLDATRAALPEHEALYIVRSAPRPVGQYTLTCTAMPVDAFWSVTVYNRDGYLEEGSNCINSITSSPEPDGSVEIHLAPEPGDHGNHLDIMDGWIYAIRLYRPRREALDQDLVTT